MFTQRTPWTYIEQMIDTKSSCCDWSGVKVPRGRREGTETENPLFNLNHNKSKDLLS